MLPSTIPVRVRRRIASVAPDAVTRRGRQFLQGESGVQRAGRRLGARVTHRHEMSLAESEPTLVPVAMNGRMVIGRVRLSFHADDVYADQATLVADALEAHRVDYFYLSVGPDDRRVLVVPDRLRGRALDALETELRDTGTYVAPVYGGRPRRPRLIEGREPRFSATLRIFRVHAAADGAFLSGPEMGCDLQFWREADANTLVNPSGEPLTPGSLMGERTFDSVPEFIEPMDTSVSTHLIDGHQRPGLAGLDHPHLLQVTQPIDAVYTWVDGSDPAWQRRKADALAASPGTPWDELAVNDSRYASHDELRYSLRSLDMYASWVRHVWVVTDDQVPPWLDTAHPAITVVSHRELFAGRGRLPTFNSHAIESQLHHIDGLAENFLYFNDDVFLGRPARPSQFVLANGLSQFFMSSVKVAPGPVQPTDLPITSAAKNNRDLLIEKFGRTITHKFQHVPYSLQRSVMFELEEVFADPVAQTARSQFRSPTDVSVAAALGHYYGFLTGRAVPGRLDYLYADIGRPDTPDKLAALLRKRNCDVFCLNDHNSSHLSPQEQSDRVLNFLSRYFPLPSQFELPGHGDR